MEFRILGPIELVDDEGRTVPLGGAEITIPGFLVIAAVVSTCSPVAPPPNASAPAPSVDEKPDYTAAVALLATAEVLEPVAPIASMAMTCSYFPKAFEF